MKLLFILGGDSLGGIERFVANALPLLVQQGHQVDMIFLLSQGNFYQQHYKRWAGKVYGPFDKQRGGRLVQNLYHVIDHLKPDLIQSFYTWSIVEQVLAAAISRRKFYLSYRNVIAERPGRAKLKTILTSWGIRGYSSISPSVVDHMVKNLGIPRRKIFMTGNGVDLDTLRNRQSEKSIINRVNNKIIVGTVARFVPQKDHQKIIELASYGRKLGRNNFHFVWFGEGPLLASCQENIRRLGLQDDFTVNGVVDVYQAPVYNGFDIFLLPSRFEGFGQVIIEAMISGIPVVASDVAGIRDIIIHRNNGMLVRQDDIPGYLNCIDEVISDPILKNNVISGGLETAKRFGFQTVVDRFEQMWRSM
jgi:glycosyltransferase involved in cell wall biosynthesis